MKLLTPFIAALALTACAASEPSAQDIDLPALAGSQWSPESGNAFIKFDGEGRISGSGGCNNFSGTYAAEDSTLSFGPIMSTKKACMGEAMQNEQAFFGALGDTASYAATHLSLILKDANGDTVITLKRDDWD